MSVGDVPSGGWVSLDDWCRRGPGGVVVHRWAEDEDDPDGNGMIRTWQFQAWRCGVVGPVRLSSREAYEDALPLFMRDCSDAGWSRSDSWCELGPSGERVHRYELDAKRRGDSWCYRAWYRGQQGPLRLRIDDAYEDATRLVEYERRWMLGA